MFLKATSILAVFIPFATAIVFNTPTNVVSGQPLTVSWTYKIFDPPTFNIQLTTSGLPSLMTVIASNVTTKDNSTTINSFPTVTTGDQYYLLAADSSNHTFFGETDAFAVSSTIANTSSSQAASSGAPAASSPAANASASSSNSSSTRSAAVQGMQASLLYSSIVAISATGGAALLAGLAL